MASVLELPHAGWLPAIRNVQIQTHSRCNADCLFCPYVESEHAAHPGTMSDGLWQHVLLNLVPFAPTLSTGKCVPYFMQEPLIDKTIFAKIADLYRYFPKTLVEISTNGAALTDKVVARLLEAFSGKRHELWVSHHGIDAATFEHIMSLPYDRSLANLLNLLRTSAGRFHIKIRGAGQSRDGKHTYFTREQYLAYWDKLFRDQSLDRNNVEIDAFTFHDRAGTLHRTDRGANLLKVGKVRDIGPGYPAFHCPRIDEWVHVDYRGNLRICCHDYHHEVKLPNLNDIWLVDYFHSQEYRELVEKVSGRIASEEDLICKRCISPGG